MLGEDGTAALSALGYVMPFYFIIMGITFGIAGGTTTVIAQYIGEDNQKSVSQTAHLKGLKIGVMGCIVNGPGEMADADYGYVGTGIGKISLYRGQKMVESNIESKFATEALINLIKEDGNWIEP